jgi:hypothetical protein
VRATTSAVADPERGLMRSGARCGYLRCMKPLQVGLVADPASPTRMARRIKDLGPPQGEHRGAWEVEVVSEPFTTGSEDVDTAL